MKTIRIHTLFTLPLLILILYSCETTIEFNQKDFTPRVVVDAHFNTLNASHYLTLSKSRFFLDNNPVEYINNAEVKIIINSQLEYLMEMSSSPGIYYLPCVITPNDHISLKISTSGKSQSVTSNTTVPFPVDVKSTSFSDVVVYSSVDKYYDDNQDLVYEVWIVDEANIVVKVDDPAEEKNFYKMGVSIRYHLENGEVFDVPTDFLYENLTTLDGYSLVDDDTFSSHRIVADELFNGQTLSIKGRLYTYCYYLMKQDEITTTALPVKKEAVVTLYSISEEQYLFEKSVAQAENYSLFSEPAQIISNIEGGTGVLGSSSCSVSVFEMPISLHNQQNFNVNR